MLSPCHFQHNLLSTIHYSLAIFELSFLSFVLRSSCSRHFSQANVSLHQVVIGTSPLWPHIIFTYTFWPFHFWFLPWSLFWAPYILLLFKSKLDAVDSCWQFTQYPRLVQEVNTRQLPMYFSFLSPFSFPQASQSISNLLLLFRSYKDFQFKIVSRHLT